MTPSPRLIRKFRLGLGLAALALFTAFASIPPAEAAESAGPLAPASLRCEYLVNPMGIDMAKPRFFWVIGHAERGQIQSAYQIVVSTDPKAAAGDIWDSGKVASPKSIQVPFAGKALESGKSYFWKVRNWDRDGRESPWSPWPASTPGSSLRATGKASGSATRTSSARNSPSRERSSGPGPTSPASATTSCASTAGRSATTSSTRPGRPTTSASSTRPTTSRRPCATAPTPSP